MKIQRILSFVLILGFFAITSPASADGIAVTPYVSTTFQCTNLSATLSYGKYDTTTNGQVTLLQNFLHTRGYLSVTTTGYFGPMTRTAVKAFQGKNGLNADGIVGVQTRAHIYATDCGNMPLPPVTAAPVISSITPTQGTTGTVITIYGTGFTASNIVHFSIGSVGTIAATNNGTTISFTVPTSIGPYCKPDQACAMYLALINAGTYPISVENDNGTSNVMQFTVTNNATVIPQ